MVSIMASCTPDQWAAIGELADTTIPSEVVQAGNEFREILQESMVDIRARVDPLIESSGIAELTPAIEAGILKLTPVVLGTDSADLGIDRLLAKVRGLILNPRIQVMFDETIAGLARSMINEGAVVPSRVALDGAGNAAVGSGLITLLPAFDGAPVAELLDLRSDLDSQLSRYRRGVSHLAAKVRSGPFDVDIAAEVEHLFRTEVAPVLDEIRQGMADHGLVRELARMIGSDPWALVSCAVGPSVGLGAATAGDLGAWASVAAGGAATAVGLGVTAVQRRSEGQDPLRKLDLYYLFEVDRRLGQLQ